MMRYALAGMAAALAAVPASALVVSGTLTGGTAFTNGGTFQIVTPAPGFTVGNQNIGDFNVRVFNEQQGVTLLSNLSTRDGVVAAGTRVSSHYLFFDPAVPRTTAIGTVTFNRKILGVMTTNPLLINSHFLGLPVVNYVNIPLTGLENHANAPGFDTVTFTGNVLSYSLLAGRMSDSIRIITYVPEPEVWAMLIAGFGLVGAVARRRRAAPVVTA